MQSHKESDQSSVRSTSAGIVSCTSWWNSTGSQVPQSSFSKTLALNLDSPSQHCRQAKQIGFQLQLQDQDSSSTQSTGQSHQAVVGMGTGNPQEQCISAQSGYGEFNEKRAQGQMKRAFSLGNPDFVVSPSQVDYSQSVARIPYPYADPCFGGVLAAYPPQAIIHPQMLGVPPVRVPLPLELSEDEPIYVNAKQYNGILRRRQSRAKLEAQNKMVKSRKPYLHESRHQHAMKRVRGSGGRFLNTQELQKSKLAEATKDQNVSGSAPVQLGGSVSESEVLQSENGNAGASGTSGSEVTSISNLNNDDVLRQPDLCYPNIHSHVSESLQGGAILRNGSQHHASVRR